MKETAKAIMYCSLAVVALSVGVATVNLEDEARLQIHAAPALLDGRIAAVQADLNKQLDATRSDLNRQLEGVRKDSVGQIVQTRTEALAAIASIKDTADSRLASVQTDLNRQIATVTDPLHATLAAVADTTPMFTDCENNPDCLFNRYQGASKAFEQASMQTARTMATIQAGTPAIVASVQNAADNSAKSSANMAKLTGNLAEATKPLPKWARIGLGIAPPVAQTMYTALSMFYLIH